MGKEYLLRIPVELPPPTEDAGFHAELQRVLNLPVPTWACEDCGWQWPALRAIHPWDRCAQCGGLLVVVVAPA